MFTNFLDSHVMWQASKLMRTHLNYITILMNTLTGLAIKRYLAWWRRSPTLTSNLPVQTNNSTVYSVISNIKKMPSKIKYKNLLIRSKAGPFAVPLIRDVGKPYPKFMDLCRQFVLPNSSEYTSLHETTEQPQDKFRAANTQNFSSTELLSDQLPRSHLKSLLHANG